MSVHLDAYKQLEREECQVAEEASEIARSTQQAYKDAISQFEMSTDSMKKIHHKQISERDNTIKVLAVSLLAVTVCAVFLGTKLITLKC
jgi:hypothetical protein